jgi:hypothetical protein
MPIRELRRQGLLLPRNQKGVGAHSGVLPPPLQGRQLPLQGFCHLQI